MRAERSDVTVEPAPEIATPPAVPPPYYLDRLRPLIEMHRARGASDGRLAGEVVAAMSAEGLFRMLQPARFGGAECDPALFFAVQSALAQIDMSAGWLHGVMGVLAFHLALFDARAQEDVWAKDPAALMASSYMPGGAATPEAGGYRINGFWGFASGADHADWFLLGGASDDGEGKREAIVFLLPRADVTVLGGWDAIGLRATGSQNLAVGDLFVPAHRTHTIRDRFFGQSRGLGVNRSPLYRIPLPQMLFRAISSPTLGGVRAMLDALVAHSRDRIAVTGKPVAQNPVIQLACAEAAAEIDEMTKTLGANFLAMLDHARRGADAPVIDRMIYRQQATTVTERCCRIADRLFKAAGASGLSSAMPFGRILADIQAARQHVANQYEAHGQMLGGRLLGLDQEDMLL